MTGLDLLKDKVPEKALYGRENTNSFQEPKVSDPARLHLEEKASSGVFWRDLCLSACQNMELQNQRLIHCFSGFQRLRKLWLEFGKYFGFVSVTLSTTYPRPVMAGEKCLKQKDDGGY